MKVRFWGVRGSIATGLTGSGVREKLRRVLELATPADILAPENIENFLDNLPFSLKATYGGNTTCVEIRTDENELVIVDGGTGLRPLGISLMAEERFRGKADFAIFFTHTHWDHIVGFQVFGPAFIPGNKIEFVSSMENLEERLRYQQVRTHWPVTIDDLPSKLSFTHLPEGEEMTVKGLKVQSKAVRHPGGCFAYKFVQPDGKTFVMSTDAEFNVEVVDEIGPYIDSYVEFIRGADLLVFDTQYTFEESLQKIDWGHSSASMATDIAIKAGVKKLVLFHHEPAYDDDKMDAVTLQALKYKDLVAPLQPLSIQTAFEGMEIDL